MRARRLPVQDEYIEEAESAVLLNGIVFVLSPLATTVLSVLDNAWLCSGVVAFTLERAYGAPPEGDVMSATHDALHGLAELGLIEIEGHRR